MALFNNSQVKYEIYRYMPNVINSDYELSYVIYSHSSFEDILTIQTDHLIGKGKLTLLINKNSDNVSHIFEKYDRIIFYDEFLPYGQKLLDCIRQIEDEYFILLHDNDIVIHTENNILKDFLEFLSINNFDRIDFQLAYDYDESHKIHDSDLYFVKSSNTDTRNKGYLYNVNPSIWKKDTLIEILSNFSNRDYRTIEADEIQQYCSRFNIFKLYSKEKYKCGYFTCLKPFRYLHITHSQKIFSPSSIPEEESIDIIDDYYRIVEKYNLRKSSKWIH